MVLLKNESLLPLPLDVPMALFGSGAKKTVKGGIGSGDVNNRKTISVYQGLLEAGAMITSEAWLCDYEKRYEQAREEWKKLFPGGKSGYRTGHCRGRGGSLCAEPHFR